MARAISFLPAAGRTEGRKKIKRRYIYHGITAFESSRGGSRECKMLFRRHLPSGNMHYDPKNANLHLQAEELPAKDVRRGAGHCGTCERRRGLTKSEGERRSIKLCAANCGLFSLLRAKLNSASRLGVLPRKHQVRSVDRSRAFLSNQSCRAAPTKVSSALL